MSYDKHQVAREFASWSESYDRSILQWLLFGPSHRVLIKRIREAAGDRPIKMLDVGCGTGVFASKVRASLPQVEVCGVDLVSDMLTKGQTRWRLHQRHVLPVQGDSELSRAVDESWVRVWAPPRDLRDRGAVEVLAEAAPHVIAWMHLIIGDMIIDK